MKKTFSDDKQNPGAIKLKKILEELADIEKKAEKIKANAEKDSKKLLIAKKEESDTLLAKEQQNMQKTRDEKFKETNERIKSEIDLITSKGKRSAAEVSKISPEKADEAQKLVIKTLLRV